MTREKQGAVMKTVPIQEAEGMVLCHDVTRIIPGSFKGRAFKKGHVITAQDIPTLLDMGKAHIYVFDPADGLIHENEAALRMARAAAGGGLAFSEPVEGRVNLSSSLDGLLKVNVSALQRINGVPDVVFATRHTNLRVRAGEAVAGTRIIPLVTPEATIQRVASICREAPPVIEVRPLKSAAVGIVTTGSEVFHGRIEDRFGPVLREKFIDLGSRVRDQVFVSDDVEMTADAIRKLVDDGADLVAVTGGMSVDPDDRTPAAIRATGAAVVTYGAPTFPGAMFMLAHLGDVPVLGLPGCVMYHRASIFDLVVPRILAGDPVTREEIVTMGHGGFCAGCADCRFPACGFGRGG